MRNEEDSQDAAAREINEIKVFNGHRKDAALFLSP